MNEQREMNCLLRLVSRFKKRKTIWIVDYEYTKPIGYCAGGMIQQTVEFRRQIDAVDHKDAFAQAEEITAKATPEGLEGHFTVSRIGWFNILFG